MPEEGGKGGKTKNASNKALGILRWYRKVGAICGGRNHGGRGEVAGGGVAHKEGGKSSRTSQLVYLMSKWLERHRLNYSSLRLYCELSEEKRYRLEAPS